MEGAKLKAKEKAARERRRKRTAGKRTPVTHVGSSSPDVPGGPPGKGDEKVDTTRPRRAPRQLRKSDGYPKVVRIQFAMTRKTSDGRQGRFTITLPSRAIEELGWIKGQCLFVYTDRVGPAQLILQEIPKSDWNSVEARPKKDVGEAGETSPSEPVEAYPFPEDLFERRAIPARSPQQGAP